MMSRQLPTVLTLENCVGAFTAAKSSGAAMAVLVTMDGCPHCGYVREQLGGWGAAVLEVQAGPGREEQVALVASALLLPSACGNADGSLGRQLLRVARVPTTLFIDGALRVTSVVEGKLKEPT